MKNSFLRFLQDNKTPRSFFCMLFGMLFSLNASAYYVSVYKDGGTTSDGAYFSTISGNEMIASVTISGYSGNPADYKFWIGNNGSSWDAANSLNMDLDNFSTGGCSGGISSCASGKFTIKIWTNSTDKNFCPHDLAEAQPSISISPNVNYIDLATPPSSIILTATTSYTTGNYTWSYSTDGVSYTQMSIGSSSTYTLLTIPTVTTYYKVTRPSDVSGKSSPSEYCIVYVKSDCAGNSELKQVLTRDFGTMSTATARTTFDGINSAYEYRAEGLEVLDGDYAVLANPRSCGCGTSSGGSVGACNNDYWYNNITDHTGGTNGGMLFVNCSDPDASGESIIYTKEITGTETKYFVSGAQMRFSAWFANAAVATSTEAINMVLRIQFKPTGSSTWTTSGANYAEVEIRNITADKGWVYGQALLDLGSNTDGVYRIQIANKGKQGLGNDVLLDDIDLTICTPTFNVHFYDSVHDAELDEVQLSSLTVQSLVRIKDEGFGSIATPRLILFSVDTTKVDGTAGKYTYYKDLSEVSGYYSANLDASLFTTIPDTIYLIAFACPSSDATAVSAVQSGTTIPGADPLRVFSENKIKATIACSDELTLTLEGSSAVCQDGTLPNLRLVVGHQTTDVRYTLKNNGIAIASDQVYTGTDATGILIDLNTYASSFTTGSNDITVDAYEIYLGNPVCPRTTDGTPVKLTINSLPQVAISASSAEQCYGSVINIDITLSSGTPDYTVNYTLATDGGSAIAQSPLVLSSSTSIPVSSVGNFVYNITSVTDSKGCSSVLPATTSADVTVYGLPTLQLTSGTQNPTLCEGASLETTVYTWGGTATDVDVTGLPAGLTLVKSSLDKTITITGNPTTSGTYTISTLGQSILCSAATVNGVVTLRAPSTIVLASDVTTQNQTVCSGSPITLTTYTIGGAATNYAVTGLPSGLSHSIIGNTISISGTPSESGIYTITTVGSSTVCNEVSILGSVTLNQLPTATLTSPSVAVCSGYTDPINLTVTLTGNPNWEVVYTDGTTNTTVSDITASPITIQVSPSSTRTYSLVSVSDASCTGTVSGITSVTIHPNPKIADFRVEDNVICDGGSTNLVVALQNATSPNYTIVYSVDGQQYTAISTTMPATIPVSVAGTYELVSVTDGNTCSTASSIQRTIAVESPITIENLQLGGNLVASGTIVLGTELQIAATVTPATASLVWYADNKLLSSTSNPLIDSPYKDTNYKLVATGALCPGKAEREISVKVLWPTVITPYDANDKNDVFPLSDNTSELYSPGFKIHVFNRYGKLVYDGVQSWDGKEAGSFVLPGVYYYIVQLPEGTVKKGTVEVFKR